MFYSPRRKLMTDVVAVPETATTSTAVISSDELKPFEESAFGKLTLFIKGDNAEISADDPLVNTYVSYDEGESWVLADVQTIDNASFTFTVEEILELAPRVRIDLDLNGATLGEGHGLSVDALFEERAENGETTLYTDVVTVPTTMGADETVNGDSLEVGEYTTAIHAVVVSDASKLTDVDVQIQSSWDGTNWWDLVTANDISATNFVEFVEETAVIGNYVRANVVTAASTGEALEDHGITVNLFARRQS